MLLLLCFLFCTLFLQQILQVIIKGFLGRLRGLRRFLGDEHIDEDLTALFLVLTIDCLDILVDLAGSSLTSIGGFTRSAILWKPSSSSSRSSEGSPPVSISSLPASSLSSIWLASVFFSHNPCGFAFRNTL